MLSNHFSYLIFGKKQGFQCFDCTGFLEESQEVRWKLESFLQLDLSVTGIPHKQGLLASYRFRKRKDFFLCFVHFFPARDAVNRPGFYGAAIVLRNKFIPDLNQLVDVIENMAELAGAFVRDETPQAIQLPNLELVDLPESWISNWNFNADALPVLVDIRPSACLFFEAAYRNLLGSQSGKAFFVQRTEDLEGFDTEYFNLLDYEDLLEEHKRLLIQQIEKQFNVLEEHKAEKISLNQNRVEQERLLRQMQEELTRLQAEEKRLHHQNDQYQQRLILQEQLLTQKRNEITSATTEKNDLILQIELLRTSNVNLENEIQNRRMVFNEVEQQSIRLNQELGRVKAQKILLENAVMDLSRNEKKLSSSVTDLITKEQQKLQALKSLRLELEELSESQSKLVQHLEQIRTESETEQLKQKKLKQELKILKQEKKNIVQEIENLKNANHFSESETN